MGTYIQIVIDQRRKKADNTFPIIFRMTHLRRVTSIKTGYSVLEKYWDQKNGKVKRGCKNIPDIVGLNMFLKRRETELLKKIMELENKGILKNMSISDVKKEMGELTTEKQNISFVSFMKSVIVELKKEKRFGTASAYQDALIFLINYSGKNDISYSNLTANFLKVLEKRYIAKPSNHYNGMAAYMRAIRAVYNRAIAKGYAQDYEYPFRRTSLDKFKYHIRSEKTKKRAVSREVMKQIEAYEPESDNLKKYKSYFLFSFYTMGMNMVDMAYLKKGNISNNILFYKRVKTGKTYEIHLNKKAWDILQYFDYAIKNKNDLIFPIIRTPGDGEKEKKQIKNVTHNTNQALGRIASELGLEIKLTTYVSRHTWATIADKSGIDRRIISKGLGHSNLHTTEIYINDIVSNEDLADANDLITGD